VNDVSPEISAGEFVCVVGRSGSGKSTLLNILAGLLTPTSGKIYFEGKDYETLGDNDRSFLRNTKLGYIMQGQSVLPNLKVLQNVILPFILFKRDGDPYEKVLALLDRVGLLHLASQYPASSFRWRNALGVYNESITDFIQAVDYGRANGRFGRRNCTRNYGVVCISCKRGNRCFDGDA
jgi:ABC-type transport system involved in cytochrome bd biosynthesis fused ATPase/permease subunit